MTNTLPSIPNYTITEPIKEIPVGCVARAQSHMDGSEHCCVIIRYTDMVPANYTRLMSLVSIVSEMRHPNICTLREYVLNVDEKVLCIIVEDYPGRSLLDLVRGNIFLYNFDPWEITRIGVAILDALEYLHNPFTTGGSIVHLGVSLEHIYVTPTGVPMLSILPLFWSLGLNKIVNYAPDLTLYRSPQILRSTPFPVLRISGLLDSYFTFSYKVRFCSRMTTFRRSYFVQIFLCLLSQDQLPCRQLSHTCYPRTRILESLLASFSDTSLS